MTEGTSLLPSGPGITRGKPSSTIATRLFVVPKSIPTILDVNNSYWILSRGAAASPFEMVCERPPRSLRSRLPLTRGRLALFSPSVRGRVAEGGRGSLTHHLELGLGKLAASFF